MSRPLRLFVDGTALVPAQRTGVGNVLLETLRALDAPAFDDRADIRVFVPFDERAALRRFEFRRIRIVALPLPHRVLGLLARLRVSLPIDLLLGRGVYFFPNFRNWSLARSRSITFVHDVCFAVLPAFVPTERRAFLARFVPMWLRRTDLVVTGTASSSAEIVSALHVQDERVGVVPTTVDTTVFRPAPATAVAALRARMGLERYLLFVGTIEPRKNLETLIAAYRMSERPPGHSLVLVGGAGWDTADVYAAIDAARSAGADIRVPHDYVATDALIALLTGADALALVSWHEGFGLPALEAVACGTPVIASDIGGLREALRGNEAGARFVRPDDVAAITGAISDAIAHPVRVDAPVIAPWSEAAEALLGHAERLR